MGRFVLSGVFPKEWMGLERLGKFKLHLPHVPGHIDISLSALIAQDREVFTERRERSHSVGLAEGDSMAEENILMKPVVLAKNDPAIIGVFPHLAPPSDSDLAGKGWPES